VAERPGAEDPRQPGSAVVMAGVTPKQIWDALIRAGASSVQAAGIMGNAIAESSLDPERHDVDSNGYYSNGLWQFNEAAYPTSGELVTGNPDADLKAQVNFLIANGGLQAASGTTVAETSGNFASQFERCQGCQPGGSQFQQRQANGATVAGWAANGDWPASAGSAATTATLTSAQSVEQSASCAWGIGSLVPDPSFFGYHPLGSFQGEVCILSKSQARALIGVGIATAGAIMIGLGLAWVVTVGIPEAATLALVKTLTAKAPSAPGASRSSQALAS
jgi:Phage tail lysozyme